MSLNGSRHKSFIQFPRIQQTSSVQTSVTLQRYLSRMRSVHMPEYVKLNRPPQKQISKPIIPRKTHVQKHSSIEQTVILETIQRYVDCLKFISMDKSSQRYRRLINRILDLIQTYPSINQKLFEEDDRRKLIVDFDVLKLRLVDENEPTLLQIINKIQEFNHEEQNLQLFSMGSRIKSLKTNLVQALDKCTFQSEYKNVLKIRDQNRSNQAISKNFTTSSQKYGYFSRQLHKREQLFSKLNKVIEMISLNRPEET